MKGVLWLLSCLLLMSFCASVQGATIYKVTFDHGVAADAPADYTAAADEILPPGVHGSLLNVGEYLDATRRTGNLIDPDVPGPQGGQSLNMMLAGAWPNKQGYFFGRDPVVNSDNYGDNTYPVYTAAPQIGDPGPVIANEYTIEVVVRPDYSRNPGLDFGLTTGSYIYGSIRLDDISGGAGLSVDQNNGTLTYESGAGSGSITASTRLQSGTWYHIAAVVRKGTLQRTELWINGALDSIGSYPAGWETQGLFKLPGYFTIGTQYWPMSGRNWQGQMDAFAISDKALDSTGFVLPVPATGPRPRSVDFGRQWVRSHPFMIFGWSVAYTNYLYNPSRLAQYKECGMTSTLIPYPNESSIAAGKASGLVWQGQPWVTSVTPEFTSLVNAATTPDDDNAWYLYDEPPISMLPGIGEAAEWLRTNRPNMLVYLNVHSGYGDSGINQVLDTVKPDVLMYDVYPFRNDGSTDTNYFFGQLMYFRNKTAQRGIPFFSWMQCFTSSSENFLKMPSESQIRMEAFASLAAGCKGLGYFIYDSNDGAGYINLVHSDGSTDPLYTPVSRLNAEAGKLGAALRSLESTDVRFIPGGSPPSGLANWTSGAGGDTHITNATVNPGQAVPYGNGLIGFFTDDSGERYFLLMNLGHSGTASSEQTRLNLTITFDSSVNQLLRLNRETGLQEVVPLANHVLSINLPGGTGDLFKYDTGAGFRTGSGIVTGNVTIANNVGSREMMGIQVQFRPPGSTTPSFARMVFLDAAGNYSTSGVAPGVYDVAFKAAGLLSNVVPNVTVPDAGAAQVNVTLTAGDLSGDNNVDVSDHSLVLGNLDQSGDN